MGLPAMVFPLLAVFYLRRPSVVGSPPDMFCLGQDFDRSPPQSNGGLKCTIPPPTTVLGGRTRRSSIQSDEDHFRDVFFACSGDT